jgi:hypothetical protein
MRIRNSIRNNLSRTAASVALALFTSLAAPVTAQALAAPQTGSFLPSAGYFAAGKKKDDSKKKDSSKKKGSDSKKKPSKKPPKKKPGSISTNQSPIKSGNLPTSQANSNTIKTILQIVFGIIGAFALLSMTASGLKYVTSAGDPGKTSEAKKGIIFALMGLMIAVTAEAIVAFVIHWGAP